MGKTVISSALQNLEADWRTSYPNEPTLQPDGTWQMWAVWNKPGEGWECISRLGSLGQMECWMTRSKSVADAWYAKLAQEDYESQPSI